MDIRRIVREEVAARPRVLAVTAVVLALGVLTGASMSIGKSFEPVEQAPITPLPVVAPQPIIFMKDANGKTPDYVIGTDNITGRKRPPIRVAAVAPPEEMAEEARPRRSRWFWPPSWGRERAREDREDPRERAWAEADEDAPRPRYRPRYEAYDDAPRDARRREREDEEQRQTYDDDEEREVGERRPRPAWW